MADQHGQSVWLLLDHVGALPDGDQLGDRVGLDLLVVDASALVAGAAGVEGWPLGTSGRAVRDWASEAVMMLQ